MFLHKHLRNYYSLHFGEKGFEKWISDCVGFVVYEIKTDEDKSSERLDADFFKYNLSVGRSKSFINLRENTRRLKLPPGTYCIIPSTYEPGTEAEFMLRLFTEKPTSSAAKRLAKQLSTG